MLERRQWVLNRLPNLCYWAIGGLLIACYQAEALSFGRQILLTRAWLKSKLFTPGFIDHEGSLTSLFATPLAYRDDGSTVMTHSKHFEPSTNQIRSIQSKNPAVLLTSGPGTGKTHALASRVAFLLRETPCPPQNMVIMSFSNRDAELLKIKAIDLVFNPCGEASWLNMTKAQLSERLWGGTIHKFAGNIIELYSSNQRPLRVLSNREITLRIDRCVRQLLDENRYKQEGSSGCQKLQKARLSHRDALLEVRQSRDVMLHQVGRCIELWKESAMLPPPRVNGISIAKQCYRRSSQEARDGCLELATRLGMTPNVAFLAWSIFPLYQNMHEEHGTGDPADLAPLAFHLLLTNPQQLSKLRSKLHHIILDEYQDISVAQHALIRLVVRGLVDELDGIVETGISVPPVLATQMKHDSYYNASIIDVPHIFCAGDSEQSIYGFRGAVPQLSVGGFRNDFPQGVIAHLDKSFRLARNMWSAVNALIQDDGRISFTETFQTSPVGASKARATLFEALNHCAPGREATSLADLLAQELSDDLTGTIHVQGVWDCREEAKHIATMIKRRARERTQLVNDACSISQKASKSLRIVDPTEIAIIVRANNQLDLIKEALRNAGLPFIDSSGKANTAEGPMADIKPIILMSMHGSKGGEFDEVYLPGWTEGVFPHPSAVSANRVEEERRLAYVAISRARHRVYITHGFVRRSIHIGKTLGHKMVTMQVRPSRFLHELVPNGAFSTLNAVDNSIDVESDTLLPTITWDRSRGSKGTIAGTNLPEYFRNSYETPKGFVPPEHPDPELLIMNRQLEMVTKMPTRRPRRSKVSKKSPKNHSASLALSLTKREGIEFDHVLAMVNEIQSGKYGSSTKHKATFLQLLRNNFGLTRGRIMLFPLEDEKPFFVLDRERLNGIFNKIPEEGFLSRPMSQSTALQLGLFILFSLR